MTVKKTTINVKDVVRTIYWTWWTNVYKTCREITGRGGRKFEEVVSLITKTVKILTQFLPDI